MVRSTEVCAAFPGYETAKQAASESEHTGDTVASRIEVVRPRMPQPSAPPHILVQFQAKGELSSKGMESIQAMRTVRELPHAEGRGIGVRSRIGVRVQCA